MLFQAYRYGQDVWQKEAQPLNMESEQGEKHMTKSQLANTLHCAERHSQDGIQMDSIHQRSS